MKKKRLITLVVLCAAPLWITLRREPRLIGTYEPDPIASASRWPVARLIGDDGVKGALSQIFGGQPVRMTDHRMSMTTVHGIVTNRLYVLWRSANQSVVYDPPVMLFRIEFVHDGLWMDSLLGRIGGVKNTFVVKLQKSKADNDGTQRETK